MLSYRFSSSMNLTLILNGSVTNARTISWKRSRNLFFGRLRCQAARDVPIAADVHNNSLRWVNW